MTVEEMDMVVEIIAEVYRDDLEYEKFDGMAYDVNSMQGIRDRLWARYLILCS